MSKVLALTRKVLWSILRRRNSIRTRIKTTKTTKILKRMITKRSKSRLPPRIRKKRKPKKNPKLLLSLKSKTKSV